jgi:hypothetical protein
MLGFPQKEEKDEDHPADGEEAEDSSRTQQEENPLSPVEESLSKPKAFTEPEEKKPTPSNEFPLAPLSKETPPSEHGESKMEVIQESDRSRGGGSRSRKRTRTTRKATSKVSTENVSSKDPWAKLADQLGVVSEKRESYISVMQEEVFEENTSYDDSGLHGDETMDENLLSRQESTSPYLASEAEGAGTSDFGETSDVVVSFREGKEDIDEAWVVREDPSDGGLFGSSKRAPSLRESSEEKPAPSGRRGRGRGGRSKDREGNKPRSSRRRKAEKSPPSDQDRSEKTTEPQKESGESTAEKIAGFGVGIFSENDPNFPSGTPKVDFDDLNEQYSVSEEEREEDAQPAPPRAKRGRRRSKRKKSAEDSPPAEVAEVAESTKKVAKQKPLHKNIPSWNEAIAAIIDENISNRSSRKRESRHRGRKR